MDVLVFNQQNDLELQLDSVQPIVESVLIFEGCKTDEISVYFIGKKEICFLHERFFNDPTQTDCITFPMDVLEEKKEHHILGEIFICPRTAMEYVLHQGEELTHDAYIEATLYLVHGLLHLIGYNDIEEKDQIAMRAEEKRVMEHLLQNHLILKRSLDQTVI